MFIKHQWYFDDIELLMYNLCKLRVIYIKIFYKLEKKLKRMNLLKLFRKKKLTAFLNCGYEERPRDFSYVL